MLVLSRKIGDSIIIGDKGEIKITLLDVTGHTSKIGILAPLNVPIHREEIYERLKNNGNKSLLLPANKNGEKK